MELRVAHVNVAKAYRGGERQTELLIRELASRGFGQVLVARQGAPLAARLGDVSIDVRRVSGNPVGVFRATHGVDVIHVHEGRSVYGAYLRSVLSGTPYIATRRVNNPIGSHRLAHLAYRRAAFVVAVAPEVADVVREYDATLDVRVIESSSSGLRSDPDETRRVRARLPGSFVVGHVGALDHRQKGQEFIIEVARSFAVRHPEVCFVLVGGGQDEAMLKRLATGLPNVVFTGFVENVGDYLAAFDVFVLPSRREGIGSILLDAMDFGLPIVATPVGGVPSIVRDGRNGILVDVGDTDALAGAIERLIASPGLRRQLGEQGRTISANYSAATMCEKYMALYQVAVARARSARAGS